MDQPHAQVTPQQLLLELRDDDYIQNWPIRLQHTQARQTPRRLGKRLEQLVRLRLTDCREGSLRYDAASARLRQNYSCAEREASPCSKKPLVFDPFPQKTAHKIRSVRPMRDRSNFVRMSSECLPAQKPGAAQLLKVVTGSELVLQPLKVRERVLCSQSLWAEEGQGEKLFTDRQLQESLCLPSLGRSRRLR